MTDCHFLLGCTSLSLCSLPLQRPALSTVHCASADDWLPTFPWLPLQVTPLPAIPVYYAYYRTFSHYKALAGCDAIRRALAHQDAEQLQVPSPPRSTCLPMGPAAAVQLALLGAA